MKPILTMLAASIFVSSFGVAQDDGSAQNDDAAQNPFTVERNKVQTQLVQGTGHNIAAKNTYAAMILPLTKPVDGVTRIVIFFHHDDYGTAPYIDLPNKRLVVISTFDRFSAYSSLFKSSSDAVRGQWTFDGKMVTSLTFQQASSDADKPLEFEPNPRGLTPAFVAGPDHTPPSPPAFFSSGP